MARPNSQIEGNRPDQNPADHSFDGLHSAWLTFAALIYFPWLVTATKRQASESSKRDIVGLFVVVDASPGELYSVKNNLPH